ncbi:hypothetical protein WEI85_06715 [Actinomycetes bacterium KLBMP 9797]
MDREAPLIQFRVTPFYHAVVVQSAGASDLPIPETGEEAAVATGESVLVATHGPDDGKVTMEVYRGTVPDVPSALVYDGELSFATPYLEIGSGVSGDLTTVDVGRIGWVPIKIYVDPPGDPGRVMVVIS